MLQIWRVRSAQRRALAGINPALHSATRPPSLRRFSAGCFRGALDAAEVAQLKFDAKVAYAQGKLTAAKARESIEWRGLSSTERVLKPRLRFARGIGGKEQGSTQRKTTLTAT